MALESIVLTLCGFGHMSFKRSTGTWHNFAAQKSRASGLAVLEDLYKQKLGAGYAVEQHRAMQKKE